MPPQAEKERAILQEQLAAAEGQHKTAVAEGHAIRKKGEKRRLEMEQEVASLREASAPSLPS